MCPQDCGLSSSSGPRSKCRSNGTKILAAFLASGVLSFHLAGQTISPPAIEWQRSFGGTNGEEAYCVHQTSDGGFIAGGLAVSGGGGKKTDPGFGDADVWVIRLGRSGNRLWDRSFGGDKTDVAFDLQQTRPRSNSAAETSG